MSPEQYTAEALAQATENSLRELSRGGARPGTCRAQQASGADWS